MEEGILFQVVVKNYGRGNRNRNFIFLLVCYVFLLGSMGGGAIISLTEDKQEIAG